MKAAVTSEHDMFHSLQGQLSFWDKHRFSFFYVEMTSAKVSGFPPVNIISFFKLPVKYLSQKIKS